MLTDRRKPTPDDPMTLALRALVWTLAAPDRADRMLALTGLEVDDLRARASEPALLAAVLGFLEAYQPDLIACAEELEVKPEALVAAKAALES